MLARPCYINAFRLAGKMEAMRPPRSTNSRLRAMTFGSASGLTASRHSLMFSVSKLAEPRIGRRAPGRKWFCL